MDIPIESPATRRDEVVESVHGVPVADPYRWLERGDDPEVVSWVTRRRTSARSHLDALDGRERWLRRLDELSSVPVVLASAARGGVVVALRRPSGAEQAHLMVGERVLVDPAADGDVTRSVDWFHLSTDGALLAYGTSEGGTEDSTLRVVRTDGTGHLDLAIPGTRACSLAWEPDGTGFWYTRYPDGDAYHRTVHHHRLGSDPDRDEVIWSPQPTPETWASVDVSPNGRLVLVTAMVTWTEDHLHLLDRATGRWSTLIADEPARHACAFTPDGGLVATTTLDAPNGRLARIPTDGAGGPDDWVTLVPERDVVLGSPVVVGERIVTTATHVAVDTLEVHDADGTRTVDGLGAVSVVGMSSDPTTGRIVVVTTGFNDPGRCDEVILGAGSAHIERVDLDAADEFVADATIPPELDVEVRHATSADGTVVPMFVLRRAGHVDAPGAPTILTGYGGFAISSTPAFSPLAAAWCERGGVYVVAGMRGGLEYGESWHRAGMREHKQRVFEDFEAVADHLVDSGITAGDRLAIAGGSNGGLLVAAALTRRPDAYAAVWCAVPLCDMVRFPEFLIARLWTPEYGDPDVAEEFEWLHAYSPYHRVRPNTCYPPVLLTTAEGDTRVDALHARKMAAVLEWASTCGDTRPILLVQEGRAGHGVGKPRAMRVRELADVASFFEHHLAASGALT